MTKNDFLEAVTVFTENAVKDMLLPTSIQKKGEESILKTADVYKQRLPDANSATKKVPYILHQIVTSSDLQAAGTNVESRITLRTIFAVYAPSEQEGALMLMELIERLRIAFLRDGVIDNRYELDLTTPLECLYYPDNTAPYYAGEMASTWKVPAVEREVAKWLM